MKDRHHEEESLAQWADSVLRQLPPRPAPSGLAPLIFAAVARRQSMPWYRRPWQVWPGSLKILFAALIGGAFVALWWFVLPHADAVSASTAQATVAHWEAVSPFSTLSTLFTAVGKALHLVLRGLNPWLTATAIGTLVILWSTTLGLGTACWRMASGPSSEQ